MEEEFKVDDQMEVGFVDTDYASEFTDSAHAAYCSMKADTLEEKSKIFNAMNNPDQRLADYINRVIYVKDLFCETVDCTKNGVTRKCPRIVLIDKDNVGYQCVSVGIYSACRKLIQIFGSPTWSEPIPVEVRQVSKGDRKMLTLSVKM